MLSTSLKYRTGFLFLLLILIPLFRVLPAQVLPSDLSYPANHLEWFTIRSDHFDIHFQEGNEESALAISAIADGVYTPVTHFYDHQPSGRTSIVLRDRADYSNGAAYFYDNKIEIYLPSIDIQLRGTHHWLRNVITHEFTHIVQLDAAKQGRRSIPAFYLQWLSYEDARRPDILYGFPKGIVTFPLSNLAIPPWFAEGTAQFQDGKLGYDSLDSHRNMLLRTRLESDSWLSLDEMSSFSSKNGLERELVYNQGFAFVNYLAGRFGEEVLRELTRESSSGRSHFNSVLEHVTRVPAGELFEEWIAWEKESVRSRFSGRSYRETTPVEERGFYNFYPRLSPDGEQIAYLTNGDFPAGETYLVLKETALSAESSGHYADAEATIELRMDPLEPSVQPSERASHFSVHSVLRSPHPLTSCSLAESFRRPLSASGRFAFSPDGSLIAMSRTVKNRYGEEYSDIYLYDREAGETIQLTHDQRIFDIGWHPSENKLTGVMIEDGRQNIVIVNSKTGELTRVTDLPFGTSLYTPVWDPDRHSILFAASNKGNRDLYRTDYEGRITPVMTSQEHDIRDPYLDLSTGTLYFSADLDGIFNIYRYREGGEAVEQLTSLYGGAFMPYVAGDEIYFSEYQADGYKISKVTIPDEKEVTAYPLPTAGKDLMDSSLFEYIGSSDAPEASEASENLSSIQRQDGELPDSRPGLKVPEERHYFYYQPADTLSDRIVLERVIEPYSEKTTPLNIYPVIRFDNYTKLRGGNGRLLGRGDFAGLGENLWRDMKVGAYFSSRDVTESLSLFGGVLLGPGSNPDPEVSNFLSPSRLLDADRDLFFTVDYSGLPFIKRSWSPTISFEFANMVRNVSGGLEVEEFPCTSCLPEIKKVDIRYIVWEAGLFLRSKINRWSLIEAGALYSPYRVKTDRFFSAEYNETIPGSSSEYFRGFTLTTAHISDLTLPDIHSDIAPKGIRTELRYRYEPGKLLRGFDIEGGQLTPNHETAKNHSVELKGRVGFPAGRNSAVQITSRFFSYFNNPEDYFYMDYSGGLSGLRSYPFFAVGGQRTFFVRSSYLTPLLTNIQSGSGPLMPDKLFLHLYAETGNGYGGPLGGGNRLKNGIGAELRVALNSYYLFPLKFFVNTSYGFNRFDIQLPANFNESNGRNNVHYGREILFYFGLTFDFDFL